MFIDDVELMSETCGVRDLQAVLDHLSSWAVVMDLRINPTKCQKNHTS